MYPGIAPQGKVYDLFRQIDGLGLNNGPLNCLNIVLIILILFLILAIAFKKFKKINKVNKDIYKINKIKDKIHNYTEIRDMLIKRAYGINNENYIENFRDLNNIYKGLENVNNNINNLKMLIPGFIDN